ncbi:MAG: biotin/lipoyl-containing protein [Opitutaceae bacterium]|jgi:biotin carboxyl carrier protein
MKKLRVTVEGKVYEVLVEVLEEGTLTAAPRAAAPVAAAAPAAAPAAAAPAAVSAPAPRAAAAPAGAGDITCPLSGKLVSIDVTIGQTVDDSTQVATIEAMKMNTYIFAPKAGKITEILATPGDGIEEGAVLIRMA